MHTDLHKTTQVWVKIASLQQLVFVDSDAFDELTGEVRVGPHLAVRQSKKGPAKVPWLVW